MSNYCVIPFAHPRQAYTDIAMNLMLISNVRSVFFLQIRSTNLVQDELHPPLSTTQKMNEIPPRMDNVITRDQVNDTEDPQIMNQVKVLKINTDWQL